MIGDGARFYLEHPVCPCVHCGRLSFWGRIAHRGSTDQVVWIGHTSLTATGCPCATCAEELRDDLAQRGTAIAEGDHPSPRSVPAREGGTDRPTGRRAMPAYRRP